MQAGHWRYVSGQVVSGGLLPAPRFLRAVVASAIAARLIGVYLIAMCALAGCAGRMWIPQGPGDEIASAAQPQASSQERSQTAQPQAGSQESSQSAPPQAGSHEHSQTAPPRHDEQERPPAAAPQAGYTQATRYGDLWFLSGQIGGGTGIEAQTNAAMKKIAEVLRERGLTMANIVHVTVHLAVISDLPRMERAYESWFRSDLPARTVVAASALPRGALVQITVIAGR